MDRDCDWPAVATDSNSLEPNVSSSDEIRRDAAAEYRAPSSRRVSMEGNVRSSRSFSKGVGMETSCLYGTGRSVSQGAVRLQDGIVEPRWSENIFCL